MALDGHGQVFGAHTFAIIGHANQRRAAFFHSDDNFAGTRIERILDQLLHRRSRPLNDFAGRNPAGKVIGQNLDFHRDSIL